MGFWIVGLELGVSGSGAGGLGPGRCWRGVGVDAEKGVKNVMRGSNTIVPVLVVVIMTAEVLIMVVVMLTSREGREGNESSARNQCFTTRLYILQTGLFDRV